MDPKREIIDLLYWMKERQFQPAFFTEDDRFVDPVSKQIIDLKGVRKSRLLWLPTQEGLADKMPGLEVGIEADFVTASFQGHSGFGVGESEAILSLMQSIRKEGVRVIH